MRGRKTSRWTDEQEMKVTDELRGKEEEKRGGKGEEWYMIANVCLGITRQCSCLNNKTGRGGGSKQIVIFPPLLVLPSLCPSLSSPGFQKLVLMPFLNEHNSLALIMKRKYKHLKTQRGPRVVAGAQLFPCQVGLFLMRPCGTDVCQSALTF